MGLQNYAVLKGTVAGHLRDADDDHYQILVRAGGAMHRIAVNVKSSAPKSPSTLLFTSLAKLPDAFVRGLGALKPGLTALASRPDGLALDYVRSGWFKPSAMKVVPPDVPGADNDLKDKMESAVVKAVELTGSLVYAFGQKWGPEKTVKDKYFRFLPGSGIHDIHMNQGNDGKYRKDNGIWQDGGLVFWYPGTTKAAGGRWLAFFLAFQSQSFKTDGNGNPMR